ncbi:phage tail tube protein [Bartonella sp. LJL80]
MARKTRDKDEDNYSIKYGSQQLLIEGIAGSDSFTAPCGITSLTKSVETNTNDIDLPPCNDPDAVIWLGIDPVSKRLTLTGSGTLAKQDYLDFWEDWSMSEGNEGSFRRVRWYRNLDADNAGYWEGKALLTQWEESSESRGRWQMSFTIVFDGRPSWTDIPAAPVNTVAPTITGTPAVGQTLTADAGTWSGDPTFTYQWLADGVAIAGSMGASLLLSNNEVGKAISVKVTATNLGGQNTATSSPTAAVTA